MCACLLAFAHVLGHSSLGTAFLFCFASDNNNSRSHIQPPSPTQGNYSHGCAPSDYTVCRACFPNNATSTSVCESQGDETGDRVCAAFVDADANIVSIESLMVASHLTLSDSTSRIHFAYLASCIAYVQAAINECIYNLIYNIVVVIGTYWCTGEPTCC